MRDDLLHSHGAEGDLENLGRLYVQQRTDGLQPQILLYHWTVLVATGGMGVGQTHLRFRRYAAVSPAVPLEPPGKPAVWAEVQAAAQGRIFSSPASN